MIRIYLISKHLQKGDESACHCDMCYAYGVCVELRLERRVLSWEARCAWCWKGGRGDLGQVYGRPAGEFVVGRCRMGEELGTARLLVWPMAKYGGVAGGHGDGVWSLPERYRGEDGGLNGAPVSTRALAWLNGATKESTARGRARGARPGCAWVVAHGRPRRMMGVMAGCVVERRKIWLVGIRIGLLGLW